jgi:hypothetical protein
MRKIQIHFNSHKNCYSIQSRETENYGKVIAHSKQVTLKPDLDNDCVEFVVRESGRIEVVNKNTKNPHAYIRGSWSKTRLECENPDLITYNPYKYDSFVTVDANTPVVGAKKVHAAVNDNGKPVVKARDIRTPTAATESEC